MKNLKLLASNYQTRLASLAYLQSAKLYEQQRDYPSARYMLKRLMNRFPNTEDAKTAQTKLALIEKKFEKSLYADEVPPAENADTAELKPAPKPEPKKNLNLRLKILKLPMPQNLPRKRLPTVLLIMQYPCPAER